ncbi:hypothetical protein [Pedobacter sp.]|uniref:baeRF3 domain-containing protein n=1 Tax=Pedobacter sp. TaxID=1411316 RepID=UPI003D7FD3B4
MSKETNAEVLEIINAVHYRPALSLIMPLQAKIGLQVETTKALKLAADKAEKELEKNYPDEQCKLIMKKLHNLLDGLIVPPNKKGLAVYVSPIFEKTVFLDDTVTEKLIVDESFEVRDLLYIERQKKSFLLLTLSSTDAKLYKWNNGEFEKLPSALPASISEFINDAPEKSANFTDTDNRKQLLVEKFLHQVDQELGNILSSQQLPLMVLTTEKIIGEFKKKTHHAASIIGYARGYTEEATPYEYMNLIKPQLEAWKQAQEEKILLRLTNAANQRKLVTGIYNIWTHLATGKGGDLVVEKNYHFAAQRGPTPDIIEPLIEPYNEFSYMRDAVDDVIEIVVKNGGEVEFTEDGVLQGHEHIALITYY